MSSEDTDTSTVALDVIPILVDLSLRSWEGYYRLSPAEQGDAANEVQRIVERILIGPFPGESTAGRIPPEDMQAITLRVVSYFAPCPMCYIMGRKVGDGGVW